MVGVLDQTPRQVAESITGFPRNLAIRLLRSLVEEPPAPIVEVQQPAAGFFSAVARKSFYASGYAWRLVRNTESLVFQQLGLNENAATRILFYGAVGYIIHQTAPHVNLGAKQRAAEIGATLMARIRSTRIKVRGLPVTGKVLMESRRVGSEEHEQLPRKTQAMVGSMNYSDFTAMGSCHRVSEGESDFLVLPAHVVAACCVASGGETVHVKGTQSIQAVSCKDVIDLATDLVAIPITKDLASRIGIPVVAIQRSLQENRGEQVAIRGLDGKGTVGLLKHSQDYGLVEYSGTTLNGYSGSGYYAGNRLVGIHNRGGSVNGGFSASYVMTLLKLRLKLRYEDSEEWLEMVSKSKNKIKFDRFTEDGEASIRYNGEYHYVSVSALTKVFGKDWASIGADEYMRDNDFYAVLEKAAPGPVFPSGPNLGASLNASDYRLCQSAEGLCLTNASGELLPLSKKVEKSIAAMFKTPNSSSGPQLAVKRN